MKKLILTNVKNIKNLNREELESYSLKVPVIISSLTEALRLEKDNSEKKDSLVKSIFVFSKKFYLVGDVYASIKLTVTLLTDFRDILSECQLYKVNSILAFYFTASGDVERGQYYNTEALKLAGAKVTELYVLNLFVQSMVAFENGNFDLASSSAKRGVDYIYSGLIKKGFDLMPLQLETLIFQLTKILNLSNFALADKFPEGSTKRKNYIDSVNIYINKLSKINSGKLKFYYYCEKVLFYSKLNNPGKAEKYLDKVF
ncbi:MAG: hypothetical protein GXO49_01330, partial [Chlorobi bacterium]|nr:hypothetical protein [Chlorobiota bacterium]